MLGVIVDVPMITLIALYKSPIMLFKGWNRLFRDLIGREGPFLETACVPFAGLAILLWPLAVAGSLVASFLSSFLLGGYASIVTYQVLLCLSFFPLADKVFLYSKHVCFAYIYMGNSLIFATSYCFNVSGVIDEVGFCLCCLLVGYL